MNKGYTNKIELIDCKSDMCLIKGETGEVCCSFHGSVCNSDTAQSGAMLSELMMVLDSLDQISGRLLWKS